MKVPALIMAGGKGKRIGLPVEKPLLPFLGKPLIDWVAEAVASAQKVSEFYVVTSRTRLKQRSTAKARDGMFCAQTPKVIITI